MLSIASMDEYADARVIEFADEVADIKDLHFCLKDDERGEC